MQTHPVLRCVSAVRDAVADIAIIDPSYLSAVDKRTALLELGAAISALEELRLRVLAAGQAAGDVAAMDGSRDAASWLAHHACIDPGRARHLGRLAAALDTRWALVADGLREGRVDLPQADVIVRALDALPDDVPLDVVRAAEQRLVAEAAHFDPRRLRVLGRRILQVVAPKLQDDLERRQLEDEEAHAARATFLRTRRRGDGTTDVHARLADAVVDRLLTYLQAFTSPRRPAPGAGGGSSSTPGDRRPHDERLGQALGAFLETVDPACLPLHGGDATTVVVTIDHDTLLDRLGSAGVAFVADQPVTAGQARRLACTARVLPAVLGGPSEVLDLGRARRLFSPAQRKALALTHPHCAADGCDIPAPWCEAHHAGRPWSQGGRTDVAEGVLLCAHHHHRAHDPRYETGRHPSGGVRFHRRE